VILDEERVVELARLAERLAELDEMSIRDGVSAHFIEIRDSGDREVTVDANREGLLHLALVCLTLAAKGTEGSHQHFDELGLVDRCDRALVIALRLAES
jgi:hypothetical protein